MNMLSVSAKTAKPLSRSASKPSSTFPHSSPLQGLAETSTLRRGISAGWMVVYDPTLFESTGVTENCSARAWATGATESSNTERSESGNMARPTVCGGAFIGHHHHHLDHHQCLGGPQSHRARLNRRKLECHMFKASVKNELYGLLFAS